MHDYRQQLRAMTVDKLVMGGHMKQKVVPKGQLNITWYKSVVRDNKRRQLFVKPLPRRSPDAPPKPVCPCDWVNGVMVPRKREDRL